MTTKTQEKRTEGEAWIESFGMHEGYTAVFVGCIPQPRTPLSRRMIAECHGLNHATNAEYIKQAWNLHEELVDTCKMALDELKDLRPPNIKILKIEGCQNPNVQEILIALLARCNGDKP